MRVAWVHPSWRDLVIAELAGNAPERQAFLAACGLDGVLLALSTAGGRGDRVLPLLREDADWDAAGDTVHRLVPELAEDELTALLRALADAHRARPQAGDVAELAALGGQALRRCAGRTLAVDALEAWWELADAVGVPPETPRLDFAALELDPVALEPLKVRDRQRDRAAPWEPPAVLSRPPDELVDRILRDL